MKLANVIFLALVVFSVKATPYKYKFYPAGTRVISFGAFNIENEREFEKGEDIIESITLSGNGVSSSYGVFTSSKDYLQISLDALIDGKYEEAYSYELSYLGNRENKVRGVREPELSYMRAFPTINDVHYFHGFKVSYRPSFNLAKQTNYLRGSHELELSYWFSYRRKNYELAGMLYSKYSSEKKIQLAEFGEERASPYSEVGIELMPTFIFDHFAFRLIGGTGNTTDYNTKNDEFKRESDKGFSVYGGASLEYDQEDFAVIAKIIATSYVFNSIDEDLTRDVDFEFENRTINLDFIWRYK